MGDAAEDLHAAEELNLQPLEDDCKLLGSLLDETLTNEIGVQGFNKLNKIRAMAQAAAMLEANEDSTGARLIQQRMKEELQNMPLEDALPIVRAFGHYLNLSSIAELQHRLRRNRVEGRKSSKSCEDCFAKLLAEGVTPEQLYQVMTTQGVEVVLTAHPTQVNRRTLQYKHTRIAALLQQNDRPDLTKEERDGVLDDLMREVTGLWQTDELRRQKPTPLDEARGGLHIVEQSLWSAVPAFMRRLSAALKKHTGKDLPLHARPFRFGSWMGGDRDGNPNVTSKVTKHVVFLARWMAADMYLREVDALRFELSMSTCSTEVWKMAKRVIRAHQYQQANTSIPERPPVGSSHNLHALSAAAAEATTPSGGRSMLQRSSSSNLGGGGVVPHPVVGSPVLGSSMAHAAQLVHRKKEPAVARPQPLKSVIGDAPAGMLTGVRPSRLEGLVSTDDVQVPGVLPGQDLEGGSECDYDISEGGSGNLDGDSGRVDILSGIDTPASGGISVRNSMPYTAGGSGGGDANGVAVDHVLSSLSALQLDKSASVGLTDPTLLRRNLRSQRAQTDTAAFNKVHNHPGFHPYRVILGDVRQKLMNTRRRMEDLLAGNEPLVDEPWYEDEEELEKPLRAIYWSLYTCGGGQIADGRLLDLIRRVSTFGMCLMKLDIRQESTRHAEAMDAITTYLGYGSYLEWDEQKRVNWLVQELQGRRPLIPPDMPMSADVAEVLATCCVVAQLGPGSLGAYVISMAKGASDVLAVELLQREAMYQVGAKLHKKLRPGDGSTPTTPFHHQVAGERGGHPEVCRSLRVVPLFETLEDLDNGGTVLKQLLQLPWYRDHLAKNHGNHQEVMLGYSDSGKDAGRLAANWALYRCQEELVQVTKAADVKLTLFHGRGGTVGRGGGPTYLAIQSQPPGSVEGSFRITEQGEMVQAKFGISAVAQYQLEIYTTAVLNATLRPPSAPKHQAWRTLMSELGQTSCDTYRNVVYQNPAFIPYFKHATPEAELGNLNIGSRPTRRRADNAGITTLRAIPWQFAWTQTRLILPSWLGIGEAINQALAKGHLNTLRDMYREWPFFAATMDLIEMILAKSDARIAALYEEVLVTDPKEQELGQKLRERLTHTIKAVLEVSGHKQLLEHNPTLRKLIQMRNPYIDPINIMQVEVLRRLRQDPNNQRLRDALLVSINGIAAGMRNTG